MDKIFCTRNIVRRAGLPHFDPGACQLLRGVGHFSPLPEGRQYRPVNRHRVPDILQANVFVLRVLVVVVICQRQDDDRRLQDVVEGVKSILFGDIDAATSIAGPPPGSIEQAYRSPLEM